MTNRIDQIIKKSKKSSKIIISSFITVGFPNKNKSIEVASKLLKNEVDIIELGIPFSDPIAEGPTIQKTSQIALSQGISVETCIEAAKKVRSSNNRSGIVLMGYFNPIHAFGVSHFIETAKNSGVDGIIVVDLPPEEDNELCLPIIKNGIHFIKLATPTTNKERFKKIIKNSSGFIYYISITGITGANY